MTAIRATFCRDSRRHCIPMQIPTTPANRRFTFLAEALNASGGFAPQISTTTDSGGMTKPTGIGGACHLVPYPRESAYKFAGRAAIAVYENHLRSAVERFVGHIGQRVPVREGLDNPLLAAVANDADWAGNHINVFWSSFMVEAKARGSMLLLVEMANDQAASQADALDRRLVPYLTAIEPERLVSFELNESKLFEWVRISANHKIGTERMAVDRYWDATEWRVYLNDVIIERGVHPFGECPVLAFTEGGVYPHVGSFAQIADLSKRIYNARSELDEILRSQTFSLLTYQRTIDERATFNAAEISATIGTHNMLVHEGQTPSFIAPPDGPAKVYQEVIDGLRESISRISFSVDSHQGTKAQESGLALVVRFQALNGALSNFAMRMQDLEQRAWSMISRTLGLKATAFAQWATDYSLVDVVRELEVLTAMQSTGFPEPALIEQRKRIAGQVFDSLNDDTLREVMASIDEGGQEVAALPDVDATDATINAALPEPVNLSPVMTAIAALSDKVDAMEVGEPASPPSVATQQPIIFNTAQGAKVIDLVRDANNNLIGANVREA